MNEVIIIGAGLAGSEAALQLSKRGIKVKLYEMRPYKTTGAHVGSDCAEFVCSNSLGSSDVTNASGLLKKEMDILGGELIKIAILYFDAKYFKKSLISLTPLGSRPLKGSSKIKSSGSSNNKRHNFKRVFSPPDIVEIC